MPTTWRPHGPSPSATCIVSVAAVRQVGFAVGHASAQLGWRGLRSRPTWRILLYSNEEPPARRGLVLVDGVKGDVLSHFVEDNPEDWAQFEK